MEGLRSGGYSQPVGGTASNGYTPQSYGGGHYQDAKAPARGVAGLDLKQFLPGARRDPHRALAGVGGSLANQINGKGVDIWSQISTKLIEKCKLGVLFQCN
jgi:hypothetical protein